LNDAEEHKKINYLEVITKLINVIIILLIVIVVLVILLYNGYSKSENPKKQSKTDLVSHDVMKTDYWMAPDTALIQLEKNKHQLIYGRELIAKTGFYYGPKGKLQQTSNGMNCQNCHLDAGTKVYGNNYSAVASTYPKFRERSGSIESITKRVNDCFERSLNGASIDTSGKEMKAIIAYMKWLGKDVEKGKKPSGAGLKELTYLNRAADTLKGKTLYSLKCKSCHAENGEGKLETELADAKKGLTQGSEFVYKYPPLWGENSYNCSAGLYRLSRLASFIKYNMPQGATFENPQLTNDEAWDIAAYVNSQPRPLKRWKEDWPQLASKPIDHPFGPYADQFTEQQHKYGPFEPIALARKK
jgi:thiosulfate dehydrogenase